MGVIDAAGCSVVHLVGGVAGLAATLYLKPRQSRFGQSSTHQMSNPTNAVLGTFMLWWGWVNIQSLVLQNLFSLLLIQVLLMEFLKDVGD